MKGTAGQGKRDRGAGAVFVRIRGVVQGVGFRPFVHRIAALCGVTGWVSNGPGGVAAHVEGPPRAVARFLERLRSEAPPAARIASISTTRRAPAGFDRFVIRESEGGGPPLSTIPPDLAICALCAAELSEPRNRRHGYPFINCTACGPRFTIVRELPYDRERTSMADFPLCAKCRAEYEDPGDRRFHAEPNACPACGPSLFLALAGGARLPADDPLGEACAALRKGEIVAVRGLGGFHLAADAASDAALRALRERKDREEKPFAVMVADIPAARRLARLSVSDAAILASPCAPVLLLPRARRAALSPLVAPGLATVGLILPYTPLHRLLVSRAGIPLVMTSGNRTEDPIATGNDEAIARLSGIADLFLLHDREIVQRSDDSVVRRVGRRAYPIRRARGLVPAPVVLRRLRLPPGRAGVVGLGGELKNTFCVVKENFAWLSQHIGDLDRPAAREFYAETLSFFRAFLDVDLRAVCHDLHPGYFTTAFAGKMPAARVLGLQHHKAHLYALLAESGFSGDAVGVSFDGTGYGEDGTIWGGEFFEIRGMEMRRAAALDPFPLQGGDSGVRETWKPAVGLLREAFGSREGRERSLRLFPEIGDKAVGLVFDAIDRRINCVATTSCGRLFDGVSALAGVCRRASYERQAPMLLEERIAAGRGAGRYDWRVRPAGGILGVDWRDTIRGIVADVERKLPVPVVSRRFHDTVRDIVVTVASRIADGMGARTVLLSGGVFQNAYLLGRVLAGLSERKLEGLIHRSVPPNDGGISLGQAYYAAHVVAGEAGL